MNIDLPKDLEDFFDELNLTKWVKRLKKEGILSFLDGMLVAEVIFSLYPQIIQLHSYSETSSAAGRAANWKNLNKILTKVRCELGAEDIAKISNRSIDKVAVITFLRLLRSKLSSYEPFYLSEQKNAADLQRIKAAETTGATSERRKSTTSSHSNSVTISSSSGGGSGGVATHSRRPSLLKTTQILDGLKSKEEVRRRASVMSEKDIEGIYEKVASRLKDERDEKAREV